MKRLVASIIAICYLCLGTGFTLHVHYCMGEQVGTSFFESGDHHKCARCGMDKKSSKKGCCHDEFKIVKAKTVAFFTTSAHSSDAFQDALLPSPVWAFDLHKLTVVAQQPVICGTPHRPPLPNNVRLYVRNCVFLI